MDHYHTFGPRGRCLFCFLPLSLWKRDRFMPFPSECNKHNRNSNSALRVPVPSLYPSHHPQTRTDQSQRCLTLIELVFQHDIAVSHRQTISTMSTKTCVTTTNYVCSNEKYLCMLCAMRGTSCIFRYMTDAAEFFPQ